MFTLAELFLGTAFIFSLLPDTKMIDPDMHLSCGDRG